MITTHPLFGTPVPADWAVMPVDELKSPEPSSCVAGPFGSNISSKYFVPDGVPVIRGSNLTDDMTRFVGDHFVFVSPERALSYRAQHVKAGDLVFTCWGTVGQVGLIPDSGPYDEYIISNKQLKLRPDASRSDPRFLFYYFACPAMVAYIRNRAIGSAVPGINLGILKGLPVVLPPLPTQHKIAAILAAYDDLIENNNRRIKILEEMTQRIYREWFVDYRYPGHEHVTLVDSEFGPLPDGWEWLLASDAVTINPKIAVERAAIRPFIPMTSLCEDGMHVTAIEQRAGTSGAKFENGDTLFARITPCLENGKTAYVQCLDNGQVASGSTEFIVLRPRRVGPEYTYLLARSERFRAHAMKSMSGATGRQRVRDECFDSLRVPVPSEPVLRSFTALARPLFQCSYALFVTNKNVRATRDLLLPRVMSGEVDVTALDIAMPEAAA